MGCIRVVLGIAFLLVGIGSIALLVRIGGTSDGPAALFIYIGAFFGLGGAWVLLMRGSQDG
jgi:hypothetical protein